MSSSEGSGLDHSQQSDEAHAQGSPRNDMPSSPVFGRQSPPLSPQVGGEDIDDDIGLEDAEIDKDDSSSGSASSLNVAHLSEADRSALYATLMPKSIQQPADIQKVYSISSL